MDTDRNLLFGVLALQADLLSAARFAEACTAWSSQKDRPLADLLVIDQRVSGEKAQRELGWRPTAPDMLSELRKGSYTKRYSAHGRA